MIGVFIEGERIGSIMHFRYQKVWVAYSYGETKQEFKTKNAAIAWLTERHEKKDAA